MKKTLLTICSLLVAVSSLTVGDLKPKNGNLQQIENKDLIQSTGRSSQGSGSYKSSCAYNSNSESYISYGSNGSKNLNKIYNSYVAWRNIGSYCSYGNYGSYNSKFKTGCSCLKGKYIYMKNGPNKWVPSYSQYGGVRSYQYKSITLVYKIAFYKPSYDSGSSYNSQYGGVRSYYWYNGRDNKIASYYYYSGDRNSSSSYNSGSSSYRSGSSYNSYRPSGNYISSYSNYKRRRNQGSYNNSNRRNSSNNSNSTNSTSYSKLKRRGNQGSYNNSNRSNSSNNSNSTNSTIVFQDRRITHISTVYTDEGSGANKDLVVTKISKVTKNCFSLGHYAQASYETPSKSIIHRYCTNAKQVSAVFKKPVSFTKGWDDTRVQEVKNASFWIPNCPRGFRALGSLAVRIPNGNTPTSRNFPEFRCIAAKFAQRARYGYVMWTDAGSGAKYDARISSIKGSPFFMSQKLNKRWIRQTIYKLKTSIKGKGF